MYDISISGFADEISSNFDEQLQVIRELGMKYISLRSADGKGIAEYTPEEVKKELLPRLNAAGVGVSSLGSLIGKVSVDDEGAFEAQCKTLQTLCDIAKLLDCRFIRIFSFYIPADKQPEEYKETVIKRLTCFSEIAKKNDIVLIHENEKDIFGDTGQRCRELLDAIGSEHFKAAFDFANFVQCGEDPALCWELLKEHTAYIHIKDAIYDKNENVLCGTGDGKIAQLLAQAIRVEGYHGFLTLEPHLVLFDSLKDLEIADAADVIKEDKYSSGAEGFKAQYYALAAILERL